MSLEEIVDLLDQHGKRATYGAVASVSFRDRKRERNSEELVSERIHVLKVS